MLGRTEFPLKSCSPTLSRELPPRCSRESRKCTCILGPSITHLSAGKPSLEVEVQSIKYIVDFSKGHGYFDDILPYRIRYDSLA